MSTPPSFSTLSERQRPFSVYHAAYLHRMYTAPADILTFCSPRVAPERRAELTNWLRDLNSPDSCQRLQILFSFSIPTEEALAAIKLWADLDGSCLVSLGAGLGYWEYLLTCLGVSVRSFDNGSGGYPADLAYCQIEHGTPQVLRGFDKSSMLFLAWPDTDGVCLCFIFFFFSFFTSSL